MTRQPEEPMWHLEFEVKNKEGVILSRIDAHVPLDSMTGLARLMELELKRLDMKIDKEAQFSLTMPERNQVTPKRKRGRPRKVQATQLGDGLIQSSDGTPPLSEVI